MEALSQELCPRETLTKCWDLRRNPKEWIDLLSNLAEKAHILTSRRPCANVHSFSSVTIVHHAARHNLVGVGAIVH